MQRVFSGVQPTGNLHLGNYLGAIRHWVEMQQDYDCLFCIVDLHAITVPQDPAHLRNATREVAAAYIACGIDPRTSIIFPQSSVSAHAELAWILNCHTPLGWLNRMTQFKEKASLSEETEFEEELNSMIKELDYLATKESELDKAVAAKVANQIRRIKLSEEQRNHFFEDGDAWEVAAENLELLSTKKVFTIEWINLLKKMVRERNSAIRQNLDKAKLGLYAYPVLMAADILAYKGQVVPVGEDQKQHLELARDIAGAFNRHYKQDYFPLPEPKILGEATRVMSLRDGTSKMSKSDPSDNSRINLTDDADTIASKIKKAKSDMLEGVTYDPATRPEASNLLNIYASLANVPRKDAEERFRTSSFSAFKNELADVAVAALSPITAKMRVLMDDPESIDGFLQSGAEKAQEIAAKNMAKIKEIVGFLPLKENPFR